jgi:hypothetical protein
MKLFISAPSLVLFPLVAFLILFAPTSKLTPTVAKYAHFAFFEGLGPLRSLVSLTLAMKSTKVVLSPYCVRDHHDRACPQARAKDVACDRRRRAGFAD